tara:strand:+ start:15259 stop:16527 length:1269 start_codon:yes stop_codon:yes gene_type:complete
MQWRLIYQSWKQDKARKHLAVMTVFLAAGLISTLLAISIGIGDKMSREMKSYGANIQIIPIGQALLPEVLTQHQSLADQSFIDSAQLVKIKDIFWRHNIMGFAPYFKATAQVDREQVTLVGTFFDQHLPLADEEEFHTGHQHISAFWQVDGQWPNDEKPEVLVGADLAAQKQWQIGQELDIVGQINQRVRITGILQNGQDEQHLVMPLRFAQDIAGYPNQVQSIEVSALTTPEDHLSEKARRDLESLDMQEYDRWFCTAYVSSIAYQLEQALQGVVVQPIWQIAASEGAVIEKIQMLLFVVTFAAFLSASMGIAALMRNTILDRYKEIGLMKSLGAHSWKISFLFYADSILSSLLGGLLGCVAGFFLSQWMVWYLFGSELTFAWIVVPCVLVLSMMIAICGTWFSVRRITHLNPVEILYGQK